jgi:hypothetical protein
LEVDLDYPDIIHAAHDRYPLAPENMEITPDMLSPYTRSLAEKLCIQPGSPRKLVSNLLPKRKYVLHYRNLKLYLRLGMELKTIHRVIEFKQSFWLKPYIDFNTSMRKQARNESEKNYYKLKINAMFGKTIENVRKRKKS